MPPRRDDGEEDRGGGPGGIAELQRLADDEAVRHDDADKECQRQEARGHDGETEAEGAEEIPAAVISS